MKMVKNIVEVLCSALRMLSKLNDNLRGKDMDKSIEQARKKIDNKRAAVRSEKTKKKNIIRNYQK